MTLQRGSEHWQPRSPEPEAEQVVDTDWDTAPQEIAYLCAALEAFGPLARNEEVLFQLLNCGVDETWFLDDNRRYVFSGLFESALKINTPGTSVRLGAVVEAAERMSGETDWARKEIQEINDFVGILKPQEIIEQDIPLWWKKLKKPRTVSALGRLNMTLCHLPPTLKRLQEVDELLANALDLWRAEPLSNPISEELHEQVRKECLEPLPDDYSIATDLAVFDEMVNGGIGGANSPDSGRLIVICARPGAGKSLVATNVAARVALRGHRVLMWSFEMGRKELAMRDMAMRDFFYCRHKGISDPVTYNQLKRRAYSVDQRERLDTPGMYSNIDKNFSIMLGNSSMTAEHVANQMRIYARRHKNTRLFIIDHLGLMNIPTTNRATAIGEATRQLKVTARELGVDVMLLCQLNRGVEGRDDKRPNLSDLRDSGRIEEDSDIVLGLYRPAYYDKTNTAIQNDLEVISLKNRQGKSNYSLECHVHLNSCAIVDIANFDDIEPKGPVPDSEGDLL